MKCVTDSVADPLRAKKHAEVGDVVDACEPLIEACSAAAS